jgi:rubrerythrin
MTLPAELVDLLQMAYSAERAASFAYQGHAGSVSDADIKAHIKQIEADEWFHRAEVLRLMKLYNVPVSRWYEFKYFWIGKFIGYSCYVIGWFVATYFAGRLESGNVNEYYRMKELFHSMQIHDHDAILEEMGIKEKEHEVYFLAKIREHKLLPAFEKIFGWGPNKSYNRL